MEKLHPKAVWLKCFIIFRRLGFLLFVFLLLTVGVSFILSWAEQDEPLPEGLKFLLFPKNNVALILLISYACLAIFAFFWGPLRYRFFRYQLGERNLETWSGVIFKRHNTVPYEKIQNIDVTRPLICRMLGLSIVVVQTAGYGMGGAEAVIPGLSVEKASQVRELLLNNKQQLKNNDNMAKGRINSGLMVK